MTVYVDDMQMRARVFNPGTGRYVESDWSHLTADTKDELHAFARRLGLRRAWFQDDNRPRSMPGGWHYDVTSSKRAQAIQFGAHQVTWADLARICQQPGREGARATTSSGRPLMEVDASPPAPDRLF